MENKSQLVNDDYFQTENGVDDLIEKKMENLKELINSNIELEEKLNKIILQIEKEEEEFQPISEKFNLEISKLDNTLSKLFKDNKKRFNELTKIKTQVNGKYSRINPFDFPKMAFKRKKNINEIFDYSSYNQLTNIKNKQIDNLKKSKNNIEKEISNIESFIKINLYSKNNLDETYNLMIFDSKIEELKVKLFELNHKLINLKKEVKELQLFYSKHSECEIIKKKYLEILERTKIEYLYLVHNQNKSELRRIDVGKIKEKILTKKKNIFQELEIKKKLLKKSNSELDLRRKSNLNNLINKKLIESLYNDYKSEEYSNGKISRNHSLFKKEEKSALINFIPLKAIEKFERKFKNVLNEKKDYYHKINIDEKELTNKKLSLNNLIKESEIKNKNYIISSKNYEKQIQINILEIQNLKRKINELNNEINNIFKESEENKKNKNHKNSLLENSKEKENEKKIEINKSNIDKKSTENKKNKKKSKIK